MSLYDEIRIGKSGEFLVCSDLSLKGFAVFTNEQQIGYDLIMDTGKRLLRVQVKTCMEPRKSQASKKRYAYIYTPRCYGQGNRKKYSVDDVDVFAFVALDIMKVAYIQSRDVRQIMLFHPEESRGKFRYEEIAGAYDRLMALKGKMTQKDMAKKIGISETTVAKMLHGKYKPPLVPVRYFTDFYRDREWFLNF